MLQWSHVLTNVETCGRLLEVFGRDVLQWSHVLTNVETLTSIGVKAKSLVASMEPRPHERGNSKKPATPFKKCLGVNGATSSRTWQLGSPRRGVRGLHRFNGATSSRTWKPETAYGDCSKSARFNGATSSRTWKPRSSRAISPLKHQLQWSHVLTNVETDVHLSPCTPALGLQWSHVLTNVET